MRRTFWPNRIFERQIFKIVTLAWNSFENWKTVRFPWKLYKTLFSGHAQHVLAKSHFWASKFSKSWNWPEIFFKGEKQCGLQENCTKPDFSGHTQHVLPKSYFWAPKCWKSWNWPQILFKAEKQCAFHENCTKRSFQVMRSTFWPNRIFERQSFQNRETGSKSLQSGKRVRFSGHAHFFKTEKECAFLSIKIFKIVKLALNSFQSGKRVRFSGHAQFFKTEKLCAFLSVKVLKIVTLAWNSLQMGKTVRFSWKLSKTLFSGHAQHVLAKSHFGASKISKSSRGPEILSKTKKQCAFNENCTQPSFQVMRSRFWPNRILELQSSQNRHARLKFSRKRENSAPSMKIVLDALYRSCAARFGEIAFLSVKVFKIVKLAWNSLQKRKTVRFRRKLYETRFSGHAQHVFAKSDFWAPKFSKSWNWPQILAKTGKQCAFHENCSKRSFQVMRSTFWPNRIF